MGACGALLYAAGQAQEYAQNQKHSQKLFHFHTYASFLGYYRHYTTHPHQWQ
jgi:hypothetical protein